MSQGGGAFADAFRHFEAGRLQDAHRLCQQLLAANPNHIDALHLIGFIALQAGQSQVTADMMRRAIAVNSRIPELHNTQGEALRALGRVDEAIACFQRALALAPNLPASHASLGNALLQKGDFAAAAACCQRVVALAPNDPGAHYNLGNALSEFRRSDEAITAYQKAIALNPQFVEAHNNLGNAHRARGERDAAIAAYRQALALRPDFALAHRNLGLVLAEQGRFEDAIAALHRAVAAAPNFAAAHNDLGSALRAAGQADAALAAYDRALALWHDDPEMLANRGELRRELGRYEAAIEDFERLLAVAPDYDYAKGGLLSTKIFSCDWRGYEALATRIVEDVVAGKRAIAPYTLLLMSDRPEHHRQAAEAFAGFKNMASERAPALRRAHAHDKIRLAYLSADFRNHALAYVSAGVFEGHDRSRFETTAIAFGPAGEDEMRTRLRAAFDRFIDVHGKPDEAVAALLRELEIDIAVDLTGYTHGTRSGILASHPAAVQASWLGYPGTSGAGYIDYVIADRFVVPDEARAHFTEQIAYLPDCVMPNEMRRQPIAEPSARGAVGLPPTGFVFVSFNNNAKITPQIFDIWMRLLRAVDGSVLWLRRDSEIAMDNLRREAGVRGIAPERLVFAGRVPLGEHFARHRLAGLFLDTLPYNAHSTAIDALWAGLPVLTCSGDSFASRVAGSLLHAIGLPELVTDNLADYEALALRLARDPAALSGLTARLARNRDTHPLFDADRFRRHLETTYETMHARALRGEPPQTFTVAPVD